MVSLRGRVDEVLISIGVSHLFHLWGIGCALHHTTKFGAVTGTCTGAARACKEEPSYLQPVWRRGMWSTHVGEMCHAFNSWPELITGVLSQHPTKSPSHSESSGPMRVFVCADGAWEFSVRGHLLDTSESCWLGMARFSHFDIGSSLFLFSFHSFSVPPAYSEPSTRRDLGPASNIYKSLRTAQWNVCA